MSPVHVIVGEDDRAEAMWAAAFTGAVDLYRFPRNVDAFERLTAAEAPIDLVVLTPAQRGPFNLTPDQFVARVLEGPLGSSRFLAKLHVIVVGAPLQRSHPRVMAVSTLDAAIRLVKFGEIERTPRPQAPPAPQAPASGRPSGRHQVDAIIGELPFSGSVISRIWDAPDPAPADARRARVEGGGARERRPRQEQPQPVQPQPLVQPAQPSEPELFTRAAAGFVATAPQVVHGSHAAGAPVSGGGHAPVVGAPGESIEVASGMLLPARPYQLPHGGAYRGPAIRGANPHGAAYAGPPAQPVPPALASQVQSMVYAGMVGNPGDPLLTWSSAARNQAPVPAAMPVAAQPQLQPPQQQVRTVPLQPPVGVYGSPAGAPPQQQDPFLRRAEQHGGAVSFG